MTLAAQSLTLTGISVDYGRGAVVENLDIHVEPGRILALLGHSGCGKSTILRVIAGLITPTAGSVHFGDTDVTLLPPWERNLGLMFQNHALFPHLSVLRNVEYGLRPKRLSRKQSQERAMEMLDMVHMGKFANVNPTELSGGQSQRIALARALAPEPRVLLLDEPFSSLDASLREKMRAEVAAIVRQVGVTTVFVTHDQDEALSIADMVAVMSAGRIVELAPPRDIYKRPRHAFTAAFVGASNLIEGEILSRGGTRQFKAGAVELPIGDSKLASGPAMLAIKPEDIAINPPADLGQRLQARLEELSFHGAHQRLVWKVEALGGKTIVSKAADSHRRLAVGEMHEIGWKASDAVVVEVDR